MEREVTMAELRQIQLDILDKIHEFCMKHGLRYSLGGGTLLGAVRHKGYIPWDDDIDIMMPRPDYDRFLKEFDGAYPHYVVMHYKNNENYPWPFAKVYDNRTLLIEHFITCGINVDVFPIDGLPNESNIGNYIRKMDSLLINVYRNTKSTSKHSFFIRRWIKRLIYHSHTKSVESLETHLHSYNFDSSLYAGAIVGRYYEKEYMKSEVFKRYIDLHFEGKAYKAITNYDSYLSKHYGDYMKLPAVEERVSNHDFKIWRK